jgi:hypothetical protein
MLTAQPTASPASAQRTTASSVSVIPKGSTVRRQHHKDGQHEAAPLGHPTRAPKSGHDSLERWGSTGSITHSFVVTLALSSGPRRALHNVVAVG